MTNIRQALLVGMSLVLTAAQPEPALSFETLDKLRDRARATVRTTRIGADISELVGLDARSRPAKQLTTTRDGVTYRLAFCLPWEDDYLLFFVERPDGVYVYRADSALSLRNAGRIRGSSTVRLDRDQAFDGFQRVLRAWEEY